MRQGITKEPCGARQAKGGLLLLRGLEFALINLVHWFTMASASRCRDLFWRSCLRRAKDTDATRHHHAGFAGTPRSALWVQGTHPQNGGALRGDVSHRLCANCSAALPLLPVRLQQAVRGCNDSLQDGTSGPYRSRLHSVVYGHGREVVRGLPSELYDVVDRLNPRLLADFIDNE